MTTTAPISPTPRPHWLQFTGALSADGSRWIAGGRKFLFPVRGLSKMFRGKYLDGVARLLAEGRLELPPALVRLSDAAHRRHWLRQCRKRSWVVYSQAPFAVRASWWTTWAATRIGRRSAITAS